MRLDKVALVGSVIYVGYGGVVSVIIWYENCESITDVKV